MEYCYFPFSNSQSWNLAPMACFCRWCNSNSARNALLGRFSGSAFPLLSTSQDTPFRRPFRNNLSEMFRLLITCPKDNGVLTLGAFIRYQHSHQRGTPRSRRCLWCNSPPIDGQWQQWYFSDNKDIVPCMTYDYHRVINEFGNTEFLWYFVCPQCDKWSGATQWYPWRPYKHIIVC